MSWLILELRFLLFECRIGFFLQFEFLNFQSFMHAVFTCIFLPLELVLFHDSMLIVSWLLTFLLRLRLFFNASASTSSAIKPVRRLKYRLELSDNLSNFRKSIVIVRYNIVPCLHFMSFLTAFIYWRSEVESSTFLDVIRGHRRLKTIRLEPFSL